MAVDVAKSSLVKKALSHMYGCVRFRSGAFEVCWSRSRCNRALCNLYFGALEFRVQCLLKFGLRVQDGVCLVSTGVDLRVSKQGPPNVIPICHILSIENCDSYQL